MFCAVTIADKIGAIEKIEFDEAMVSVYFFHNKHILPSNTDIRLENKFFSQ